MGCKSSVPIVDSSAVETFASDIVVETPTSSAIKTSASMSVVKPSRKIELNDVNSFDGLIHMVGDALYKMQMHRTNIISHGTLRKYCQRLAAFRNPKSYMLVGDTAHRIDDEGDLQFWRDYADKQPDSIYKRRIISRYNLVLHGASGIRSAKRLKNVNHLKWWHSQYPNEGFDEMIQEIQHGAKTAEKAVKANLTREQAQHWLDETGDTAFQIKLIEMQASDRYGLFGLPNEQIVEMCDLAKQSQLNACESPLYYLDILCRRNNSESIEDQIASMLRDFEGEELWTAALKLHFRSTNSNAVRMWPQWLYKHIARIHPVHENDFWPIRHLLLHTPYDPYEGQRMLKGLLSHCYENPRDPYLAQLAQREHEIYIETLNAWSYPSDAPPPYTE